MKKPPKIIIAINYVDYSNVERKKAQKIAIDTMITNAPPNVEIVTFNLAGDVVETPKSIRVFKTLERNSRRLAHNNRDMPYVREILDSAARLNCNIFGYVNSDILLSKEFFEVFNWKTYAYVFSRIDVSGVNDVNGFNNKSFKVEGQKHPGFDGFFFSKNWWDKNRNRFDSGLIIGEPEWDFYYAGVLNKAMKRKHIVKKRLLHHAFHHQAWNIETNGAKNNRRINGSIP